MENSFIEPISPATLQAMRALDQQAASVKMQMESMMRGYIDAKGWGTEQHKINMNLVNGTISVEVLEIQPESEEAA